MEHVDNLTQNERAWLDFLRLIANGTAPAITLCRVQLMRRICKPRRAWRAPS